MEHTFYSKADGDKSTERLMAASAVFWSGVCQHDTETPGSPKQDIISLCNTGGFPGGSAGKESACSAGDQGSVPGWGRSSGGGHGNPLQYSCLENPMDREPGGLQSMWVTKSQTRLSD